MPPRAAKKLKVEKVAPMKKQNKKATKPATPPEAFSLDLCKGWFSSLLVSNESDIGPEGIEQICLLLNIDITSIDILLIAFKLNAAQMGFFTLNEWTSGMQKLQCDSIDKLALVLPNLRIELKSKEYFRLFYNWCFNFAKGTDSRIVPIEVAIQLFHLLFKDNAVPHAFKFMEFMEFQLENSALKSLNRDQWASFWEFSNSVDEDCGNYDENSSWPSLYDSYVEWAKSG